MRRLILLSFLALLGLVPPAAAQDCGLRDISVARMQWPSAGILAEIHALLLAEQLGCRARTVPGDLAASASSMATTGQPAIAPELWVTRVAEIWNAGIGAKALRPAGQSYQGGAMESWFIPGYVAAANPGLTSASGIAANIEAFLGDSGARPTFISCPPDWACALINRNLLAALGLSQTFEVVEPANRLEMDQLIGEAVNRSQPVLFYYWQPNAILSQFDFRALDMGPFNAEAYACLGRRNCPAPMPTSFVVENVVNAAASWVFQDVPVVTAYLSRAVMPLSEMNALLARLSLPGATEESVAQEFVDTRRDVWGPWVAQ